MINLSLVTNCDRWICMTLDIGSIIIGLGIGVILITILFKKRLMRRPHQK